MLDQDNMMKEILFWNLVSFKNLTSVVNMYQRRRLNQIPNDSDRYLRDFYFSGVLPPINKNSPSQSFLNRISYYLKDYATFDRSSFLVSQIYDIKIIKHQFWNRIWKMKANTKEAVQDRAAIQKIVWVKRIEPLCLFFIFSTLLVNFTGLKSLHINKKIFAFTTMGIGALVVTNYRKSSQIFYQIPRLNNQELQKQRLSIINESIVMDGTINQLSIPNPLTIQLITIARSQTDEKQKANILKAAGFIIIDKDDYQYEL